jgi:eukaryotic-like serine/threonine-protein kinase
LLPSNLEATRLYSEGLAKLRFFDASGARDLLEKAVAIDPKFALAHSALEDAWAKLGYEANARAEAKKALDLAASLPREKNLEIEARYFLTVKQGDKAIEIYRTLFNFFPDNLDYGLELAGAQFSSGKPQESLQTIALLRKFPVPEGQDPRIDLTEANAVASSDHKREADAAHRAALKADAQGSRLLAGRARVTEGRALNELGDNDHAIIILEEGKHLLSTLGDGYGEALALKYLAHVFMSQDKFEDARTNQAEALEVLQRIGNRGAQAGVLNDLADVLLRENNVSEAEAVYGQALTVARELGRRHFEANVLTNIASLETMQGNLRNAKSHFEEALAIEHEIAGEVDTAFILTHLAEVLQEQGNPEEAEKLLADAIKLSKKSGDKQNLCESLVSMAQLRFDRYGPTRAKELFQEALQDSSDVKNDMTTGYALSGLGAISAQEGNLAQARKYQEQALRVRQTLGDGEFIAQSWLDLAHLSLDEDSPDKAQSLAQRAAAEFHKQKDSDFEARAKALAVEALIKQGKVEQAQGPLADARSWAAKTQDLETLAIVNVAESRLNAAMGSFGEAEKVLNLAIKDTQTGGFGSTEMDARLALGEVQQKAGNYKAAAGSLRSLERTATARGFVLTARKAAAARRQSPSN